MATASTELVRATAQTAFWQNFEPYPDIMDGIVMQTSSDSDQEIYPWLAYAPGVKEMVGSRTRQPVPALDWTIKNLKWENTVPIAYELRRFNRINAISSLVANLGAKARAYPNERMTFRLNNGFQTACYDTQFFFDTDHSDPGADYTTSQDNDLGANIGDPLVPSDIEFATGVRACINALHGFKDGAGDPVVPGPNPRLILHCPAAYLSLAHRVMRADSLTGPVGNDLQGRFEVVHNPWMEVVDGTNGQFYVFNASGARKPFIYQVADPVTLEDDMDGDSEFNTKEVAFGSFSFGEVHYGDWRYACRYEFT